MGTSGRTFYSYVRWYAEAHSPVLLLAALAPLMFWRSNPETRVNSRHFAIGLVLFAVGVYLSYLPYFPYSDWEPLRETVKPGRPPELLAAMPKAPFVST